MYRQCLLVTFVTAFAIACSNGANQNNDNGEEVGCNQLTNETWVVSNVTCNGAAVSFPYAAFTFNGASSVTRTFGGPDCQASYVSNVTHTVPAITMVGEDNFSCQQAGSVVSSCSGTDTTCSNTLSAENITNSYSICVLQNLATLRFSRTVASEDLTNNVSFCGTAGEVEEVVLIPEPTGIAFLSISDGAIYDYGTTAVGTPLDKTFTVTNSGDTDATAVAASGITSPFLFTGGAYPGVGGNCGTTIAAGSSCTIVVQFNPSAADSFSDTLILAYHNGSEIATTTRGLSGASTAPPAAILTISGTDPIDFGIVTTGMASTPATLVTITNTGNALATAISETGIIPPFQYTGGTYPGSAGTCGITLAATATCTLELEFAPAIAGPAAGSISLDYNDSVTTQTTSRTLSGTGL